MDVQSEGVETGDPRRPFLARVTIGTRKNRAVLAEFEAPSLTAARSDADDWMGEYCARIGLGGVKYLDPSVMRSRLDRLRDGMPSFPEPGEAYCKALSGLAFDMSRGDAMDESRSSTSRRRQSYPSRSKIVSAVAAARAAEIDVAGIRVWPDGSIAVFDQRGIGSQQPAEEGRSAYDQWKASRD